MLQRARSLGVNYDELLINVKNIFTEIPLIALTENWLKPISKLLLFSQHTYKNIITCSRQGGKGGSVVIMCRENTKMQTFKVTDLTELQIPTVKTYFFGRTKFITVL